MAYKKKGKPQRLCKCGEKFLGVGKYCPTCQDLIYSKRLTVKEYNKRYNKEKK